jgi:ubiquinone biosynthesis protein COQ4
MLAVMGGPAMTTATAPFPKSNRFQARRAFRLLGELIRDPSDTDKVFALFEAVGGDDGPGQWKRFLADPGAPRLLAARPRLVEALADEAYLSSLPAESFGGSYLRFMRGRGFSPAGLLEARERGAGKRVEDVPENEWLYDRINVMHDLWHVLTGYGTDECGEAALLAFSFAHIPSRGFALLLLAAIVKGPTSWDLAWPRYLWNAYRRGRRAKVLIAAPFEELLPLSVYEVRQRLRVEPPSAWHPEGVRVGKLFAAAAA